MLVGALLGALNFGNILCYARAHQLLPHSPAIVLASMNLAIEWCWVHRLGRWDLPSASVEAAGWGWHWRPLRSLEECAWAERTLSAYATPVRSAPSGPEWDRYDER